MKMKLKYLLNVLFVHLLVLNSYVPDYITESQQCGIKPPDGNMSWTYLQSKKTVAHAKDGWGAGAYLQEFTLNITDL